MTWEENNYLVHYGVKGQKHGIRRYQNEDGSLTEEGKERYGGMTNYSKEGRGLIGTSAERSHGMTRAFADWRSSRHNRNLKKAEAKGDSKKIEKYKSKKEAQDAANSNLKAYRDHSSTAKLLMRSAAYEHARARGTSRGKAFLETIDPTGITRMRRDKKAYGKYIVYSGISENESVVTS